MMMLPKKCTAINTWLLLTLLCFGATAYAGPVVGTVTHTSGLLFAKSSNGTLKFLAENSVVEQGDALISEKNTYAKIQFTDNSKIILRPNSQLSIDEFAFREAQPQSDNVVFNLHQGGVEVVSGLVGKRSNERFTLKTATASITIREGSFIAEYVTPEESTAVSLGYNRIYLAAVTSTLLQDGLNSTMSDVPSAMLPAPDLAALQLAGLPTPAGLPSSTAPRAPGLYVQVLDGIINLSNKGGTQSFAAGQFGFTPSFKQPPVVLPVNPGIMFQPPPSFSSSFSPQSGSGGKAQTVDCEVR
jgi:hypothetical protein